MASKHKTGAILGFTSFVFVSSEIVFLCCLLLHVLKWLFYTFLSSFIVYGSVTSIKPVTPWSDMGILFISDQHYFSSPDAEVECYFFVKESLFGVNDKLIFTY